MSTAARRQLSLAFAVAWLAYFVALQWSVVRFKVPIVIVLTISALLLVWWQARRCRVELSPAAVVVMLGGSALATLLVPLFSYLEGTGLSLAMGLLALLPVLIGALLWPGRPAPARVAALVAIVGYLLVGAVAIRSDPAPRIDVWVTLQQASDALADGVNFYAVTWSGSPGVSDAFTYLPWTAVLLAPGRWLAGDVRWALLVWTVVAAVGVWALAAGRSRRASELDVGAGTTEHTEPTEATGTTEPTEASGTTEPTEASGTTEPTERNVVGDVRRGGRAQAGPGPVWLAAAAITLLLFAPGTLTQVDQAWSEPLLLAGLVWWAVLVDRNRAWWAVIPLALACASKQHLALLLPVLLVWRPVGVRRTLSTGALTGVLIAPWFLAGPADFVNDTVTLLISFHAILFANTLYLLALNVFGVQLPFWVTGLVVLGSLAAVLLVVRRRQPALGELLRWLALLLLIANLVNKQAFYNQYWLVVALVVVSLVVPLRVPAGGARAPTATSADIVRPPP